MNVDLQSAEIVFIIRNQYYDSKFNLISADKLPRKKILITVREGKSNFIDEMLMDLRTRAIELHEKERLYTITDGWVEDEEEDIDKF